MKAFHSFWTKPGQVKHGGEVGLPDYELLTAMLSALSWREHNGPIVMKTDSPGADYFCKMGLQGVWDEIDTCLDGVPDDIDPFLFWAAGKLYALETMDCPCAMLDTDLIIWKDILPILRTDVVAAHPEEIDTVTYPDPGTFQMKSGYRFPAAWDFTLKAANTAFLYIENALFRDYYVHSAKEFMIGLTGGEVTSVSAMCFAEQRILPMCADAFGLRLAYLLDQEQDFVTHIWGYKRQLERNVERRGAFCVHCVWRILQDYPAFEQVIADNQILGPYYRICRQATKETI